METLMSQFECHLEQPVPCAGEYIFPVPIDTSEQKISQFVFEGVEPIETVQSLDGAATAFRFALKAGDLPIIQFSPRETRFDQPSQALVEQISSQFTQMELVERVPNIIQFIADHFQYGQRDIALGDDETAMPALECGLTFGTCVDMHTLAVAALRAIGVQAAYVMGGHVATTKQSSPTGHCWINVRHEGVAHHWDISHHVQYGVKIITPELNPKPGRRFALSIGRGHVFAGQDGNVEFPALSGFQALTGDLKGQKLRTMGQFAP
jgi:hypothetical protein